VRGGAEGGGGLLDMGLRRLGRLPRDARRGAGLLESFLGSCHG
jgi:hypothetical protein